MKVISDIDDRLSEADTTTEDKNKFLKLMSLEKSYMEFVEEKEEEFVEEKEEEFVEEKEEEFVEEEEEEGQPSKRPRTHD